MTRRLRGALALAVENDDPEFTSTIYGYEIPTADIRALVEEYDEAIDLIAQIDEALDIAKDRRAPNWAIIRELKKILGRRN